jgi:hypothetical protein
VQPLYLELPVSPRQCRSLSAPATPSTTGLPPRHSVGCSVWRDVAMYVLFLAPFASISYRGAINFANVPNGALVGKRDQEHQVLDGDTRRGYDFFYYGVYHCCECVFVYTPSHRDGLPARWKGKERKDNEQADLTCCRYRPPSSPSLVGHVSVMTRMTPPAQRMPTTASVSSVC